MHYRYVCATLQEEFPGFVLAQYIYGQQSADVKIATAQYSASPAWNHGWSGSKNAHNLEMETHLAKAELMTASGEGALENHSK